MAWYCLFILITLTFCNAAENEFGDHRTNFCPLHEKLENGGLLVKDALRGMNISAAVSSEVDELSPYISVRVLNEIALRAGFSVEYINTGRPAINESWTDVLVRNTEVADVACDWWQRRVSRLDLGMVFAEEWYDADTIMVKKPAPPEETFSFWAFSKPFSPGLWIMILFIVNATGVVYYFLDYLKSKAIGAETDTNFLGSVFFSFHAFTGHCNYTAKSRASQVLTTSMCFLYLILISAYTANLANFFIAKTSPEIVVTSISDVVKNKLSLCVLRGYPFTELIKVKYPNANLISRETERESITAVSEGLCDIGLTSMEEWKTLSRDNTANIDCDLEWIGRRVDVVPAGFATKDSRDLCSSFLNNVLNYHIISMKADGILDEIWTEFRDSVATASCDLTPKVDDVTKKTKIQLNIKNMSGAFAFHLCFVAAAICLALYEFYLHPPEMKKQITGDLFSSFEEALRASTKPFQRGSVNSMTDTVDSFTEEGGANKVSLKSLSIVRDLCSSLSTEDMNNLILQNQILVSQKLEYILSLTQRNRALFCRKFDQQALELIDIKENLRHIQSKLTK